MYFSFWYNRCCVDPVTAKAISNNDPPKYVDLIRYVRPAESVLDNNHPTCRQKQNNSNGIHICKCSCNVCKGETSVVIINTNQHNVETAFNMNPMLMQIIRLDAIPKTYDVVYTFITPSIYDVRVLNKIFTGMDMSRMFVSTRLNIRDDVEDESIFKLLIYQRRTPYSNSNEYILWMCQQIERVINCKPVYDSTSYVSSLTPCSYSTPRLWLG